MKDAFSKETREGEKTEGGRRLDLCSALALLGVVPDRYDIGKE